jgi:hypothetical protein
MKIKQALTLLFAVVTLFAVQAQTKTKAKAPAKVPAFKCDHAFQDFEEKITAKEYTNALPLYSVLVKNCPKYNANIYVYGETALKDLELRSRDEVQKKGYVTELIALYDAWEKNYPNNGAVVKKAVVLHDKNLAKDDEVYKLLEAAFVASPQNFTDYTAIELYFNLYLKEFEAGKGITPDQFTQRFGDVVSQIAYTKGAVAVKRAALHKKREETQNLNAEETAYLLETRTLDKTFDAVTENMFRAASKYFSCEKLEAYYAANYDKNKENAAWLHSMVSVLTLNKCNRSELLYNGALALHTLNPAYNTAFQLGYLSQKRGNATDAISYYEQAVALQPDPVQKSIIYDDIATLYRVTDKGKGKEYALKSAAVNPKSGKPYLFIAGLYASPPKDCKLNDFETKALKLLAIETLKKAEAAEPKYKPTVAALTEEYTKGLPTKKEAKAFKKGKGDVITYGCWINESVTLPKLK